jgi:hypothetical protein
MLRVSLNASPGLAIAKRRDEAKRHYLISPAFLPKMHSAMRGAEATIAGSECGV